MNKSYTTGNFTIKYSQKDENCVADVVKTICKAQENIFSFLNRPFQAIKIDIYLYSNTNEFQNKIYGKRKERWNVCAIKNDTIHAVSPLCPGEIHKYNDILLILGKAVQDIILTKLFNKTPKWFGITILTSGLMSDKTTHSIPKISNFNNDNYYNDSDSYFIANFIFNKFGRDVILEILRWPDNYNEILQLCERL